MTYLVLQQLDNVSHFQSGSTCWSHGVSLIWGHWQHLWFFFCKIPLLLFCLCLRGWLYPSCFQFVAQKKKKTFACLWVATALSAVWHVGFMVCCTKILFVICSPTWQTRNTQCRQWLATSNLLLSSVGACSLSHAEVPQLLLGQSHASCTQQTGESHLKNKTEENSKKFQFKSQSGARMWFKDVADGLLSIKHLSQWLAGQDQLSVSLKVSFSVSSQRL